MTLPYIFSALSGDVPASNLDDNFNALGAMGTNQCTATGINTLTLTSISNQPDITSYQNYQLFGFVAPATPTGAVDISIDGLSSLPLYQSDGVTIAGLNAYTQNQYVVVVYNSVLNSGSGGFQIIFTPNQLNIIYQTPSGFQNKIRNGTTSVFQRGTSGTITAGTPAYSADGWIIKCGGANVTWARAAGRALTPYSLQVTGASGVTDTAIYQNIESYSAAALAGNVVTFQIQYYNNTGSPVTPTLSTNYASSTDVFSSVTSDLPSTSLQTCPSGQWTQLAYTLNVSSFAKQGYQVVIDFGSSLGGTGLSLNIGEADIRVTPGVSTGLNTNPPIPEIRSVAIEETESMRFYEQFTINPAGYAINLTPQFMLYSFKVQKRATPTMTTLSVSYFNGASAAAFGYPNIDNVEPSFKTGATNGYITNWTISASAELI